jgi:hypothetical protein
MSGGLPKIYFASVDYCVWNAHEFLSIPEFLNQESSLKICLLSVDYCLLGVSRFLK